VTGSGSLPDLAEQRAVAIVPAGGPPREGVALISIRENLTLPVVLLWPAGAPTPAVRRVRDALSHSARPYAS
jgi:hypothetical protein